MLVNCSSFACSSQQLLLACSSLERVGTLEIPKQPIEHVTVQPRYTVQVRAAHRRTCLFGLGLDLEPARKCAASGSSQRERQQGTEETERRGTKGGLFLVAERVQNMTGSKRSLCLSEAMKHSVGPRTDRDRLNYRNLLNDYKYVRRLIIPVRCVLSFANLSIQTIHFINLFYMSANTQQVW